MGVSLRPISSPKDGAHISEAALEDVLKVKKSYFF